MPYSSIEQAPASLRGAGLTLAQINDWARYYDSAKASGTASEPAAVAWTAFKNKYKKVGDKWVRKTKNTKPWDDPDKKEGTMRSKYGRARDNIAKQMFGKMFDELTDEQKQKVHDKATAEHSINIGNGNIVCNANENGITKFDLIVQTEGIHQGVTGNKVKYTKESFDNFGDSIVGKFISDDPLHNDKLNDKRRLGSQFAKIVGKEVMEINKDMVDKFGIDESLIGKYALVAHAEGFRPDYNYLIENGGITHFSSELSYTGEKDDEGVWNPTNINYDGIVALSDEGADPGAIMLDVYNYKYGENKMTEEITPPDLEKRVEELNAKLEEAEKEKTEMATKLEELNKKDNELREHREENIKLQKKIEELEQKDEYKVEHAKKAIEELKAEKDKELEELNSKIKEMRDEKRTQILSEVTANEKTIKSIIEQDLTDEEFNTKIEEIKELKEEAKKEFEKNMNSAGIPPGEVGYNIKYDDFEKEWNIKRDDLVKEITGGKI